MRTASLVVSVFVLSGCQQALSAVDLLARKTQCGIANQNLPNEQIIERCALEPGDVERILAIVGTAREESTKEAIGAMNRQAEQDRLTGACK